MAIENKTRRRSTTTSTASLYPSFLVLLALLSSLPLLQASRSSVRVQEQRLGMIERHTKVEMNLESSERQVPTGPDPLHHSQNPVEP